MCSRFRRFLCLFLLTLTLVLVPRPTSGQQATSTDEVAWPQGDQFLDGGPWHKATLPTTQWLSLPFDTPEGAWPSRRYGTFIYSAVVFLSSGPSSWAPLFPHLPMGPTATDVCSTAGVPGLLTLALASGSLCSPGGDLRITFFLPSSAISPVVNLTRERASWLVLMRGLPSSQAAVGSLQFPPAVSCRLG